MRRFALAVFTAGVLAALAVPATAGASTVSNRFSTSLGGYSASFGTVALNSSRTNVTLPNLSNAPSPIQADSVAAGAVLQADPNGTSLTLGAGWVWNDTAHPGACEGQWTLEEGAKFEPSQTAIPAPDLKPILDGGQPFCTTGGPEYTEVHWSSFLRQFAVVSSPVEADGVTVYRQDFVVNPSFDFLDAGIGVDTSGGLGHAAATLPNGTMFGFTRNGLTEVAGQNIFTIGGRRVTLDAFPNIEFIGSTLGVGTPSDTITLQPSALPAPSSNFTVTVP